MEGRYTTRTRFDRPYRNLGEPNEFIPTRAELTYSWRSRQSPEDLTDLQVGGNFGIVSPKKSGTVFDLVSDRTRWLNELGQTFGGVTNPTDQSQCTVYSATDTGHYFHNIKWEALQVGRYRQTHATTGVVYNDVPVLALTRAVVPPGFPATPSAFPVTTIIPGGLTAPSALARQDKLNQVFYAMAPQAPTAQLGETIISLLRGEFPSVLRNLSKWLRPGTLRWKEFPQYAGGEYLNSVFGWQPLIRDLTSAIRTLLVLDRLIYGEAYRRSRVIKWADTMSVQRLTGFGTHPGYSYQGSRTNGSLSSDWGARNPEQRVTMSYDTRLSARLVPLARPGLGANSFVSQAEDYLTKLGVWYPTLGWDLVPYSWLVDWFLHLGTAFGNAQFYSLGSKFTSIDYAWATTVMRVRSQIDFPVRTYDSGIFRFRFMGSPSAMSTAKFRERATPFGFGVDLSGLNPGQIAILVALGLVKVR